MPRSPWTREELEAAIPAIGRRIAAVEAKYPEARPLMPMTTAEARRWFERLMDPAAERPLTRQECFLHGQLLAVFQHAVKAETIGRPGRYFVFGEAEINDLLKGGDR